MAELLKAPFQWFGGKSLVADLVWSRFGDVPNYVEPFAGSLAVMLMRPSTPKKESVNDLNCYLANFWRAISLDAPKVAKYADWPSNEADLVARNKWLVNQTRFVEQMKSDPNFYDARIAGWWVWGQCNWLGSGWCDPSLNASDIKLPLVAKLGVTKQSIGEDAEETLYGWFERLQKRLRRVTVACGSWERVVGKSYTYGLGLTGVFLDPPYDRVGHAVKYAMEQETGDAPSVSDAVREWAIANGGNKMLRIALCGYEGEHPMPSDWDCVSWKATGGFSNQRKSGVRNDNPYRERIWFSPHCLRTGETVGGFGF